MVEKKTKYLVGIFVSVIILFQSASCSKKPAGTWYVQQELYEVWAKVVKQAGFPDTSWGISVWDGTAKPDKPGILIATRPWQTSEKISVYYRLSWDLEYKGAMVLALDPWMIFRKSTNAALDSRRVFSETGGNGVLLVPGKDEESIQAWTARFVQTGPGKFAFDDSTWENTEKLLFVTNRFPAGSQTYNWQEVFFRLMGNETTWIYAPVSAIRGYQNPRKAILEASVFPEANEGNLYSLQAKLLWALPVGSEESKAKLASAAEWLKKPATQTIIADILEWIPADPYGTPYDPVSLTSHRLWLTASYIYEVN